MVSENGMRKRNITCQHFMQEGFSRRTISRIVNRYLATGKSEYNYYQHAPRTVSTPKVVNKVNKLLDKNPSISVIDGANQIGIKESTFFYIKKKILFIIVKYITFLPILFSI